MKSIHSNIRQEALTKCREWNHTWVKIGWSEIRIMERQWWYAIKARRRWEGQVMFLWGAWLGRSSEHQIFDKSSSSCQLGMPSSFAYAWVCSTPVSSVIPDMPQPRRIPFVSLDDTFFAALLSIQFFRTYSLVNLRWTLTMMWYIGSLQVIVSGCQYAESARVGRGGGCTLHVMFFEPPIYLSLASGLPSWSKFHILFHHSIYSFEAHMLNQKG